MTKLKAFADDKLNIDKMMISLYNRVGNTVGKGKMLVTSIFSFSHSVFQSLLFLKMVKSWNHVVKSKPIPTQWHFLTPLGNKPFENTVGKGEIARNKFLSVWITFCQFLQILNCRLQTVSVWKGLKFVVWLWVNYTFCCWTNICVKGLFDDV